MKSKISIIVLSLLIQVNANGQNNKTDFHGDIDHLNELLNKYNALIEQSQPLAVKPPKKYEKKTGNDGFTWYPFEEDSYLGAKNENGSIIIPAFFSSISYKNGLFITADRTGIYSVYKKNGELVVPANDVVRVDVNEFDSNSPIILTTQRRTWLAVNREGDIIIPEDFYTFIFAKGNEKSRWLWVGKDGYQGIIDEDGKVIIPLNKYNRVDRVVTITGKVLYNFGVYGENHGSGVCNAKGEELIRTQYYETSWAINNDGTECYNFLCGDQIGQIDVYGKPISIPYNPKDRIATVQLQNMTKLAQNRYNIILSPKGKMGVKNAFSRLIIPQEFDNIVPGKKHFLVTKGNYMGAYDKEGNCIIQPNKYHALAEMSNYFSTVPHEGKSTVIDFNGKELFPLGYCNVVPLFNKQDTIFCVHDKNKCAIFNGKKKQLTDFIYDSCSFLIDNINGNSLGYLVSSKGRFGYCTLDGKEIIEPVYTDIDVIGISKKFLKVMNGNKCGICKFDGTLLFPPDVFEEVRFMEDDNCIVAVNTQMKCIFDTNGKLLINTKPNPERDRFILQADEAFENGHYDKAAKYYGNAIDIEPSASLFFNRAAALFNCKEWNKAIKDYNRCLEMNPSQRIIDQARAAIYEARANQSQVVERRQNVAMCILGLVFGVADNVLQNMARSKNSYSSSNVNYDYLIDPYYNIQQVNNQNWQEYMTMTNGGKTMSFEEWYSTKAQSYSESYNNTNRYSESINSHMSYSDDTTKPSKSCMLCYGTGDCRSCDGKGYFSNSFGTGDNVLCPNCKNHNGKCSSCNGTGRK